MSIETFPNIDFWTGVASELTLGYGLITQVGDGMLDPATVRILAITAYAASGTDEETLVGWGEAYAANRIHRRLGLR